MYYTLLKTNDDKCVLKTQYVLTTISNVYSQHNVYSQNVFVSTHYAVSTYFTRNILNL